MPKELPKETTVTPTHKLIHLADDDAGGRLDRVLAAHVAELSRTRLRALIEAGAVAVDGRTIRDPSHRVNSGAAIALDIPQPAAAKPAAEAIPLNVVYRTPTSS
jgi:23S rRNA pseudouridine1911/1915/1917 synthase